MYQPYRGQRSQRQKLIRNFIIVLLCLFIATCAIFLLFFQDEYRQWREAYLESHAQKIEQKVEEPTNTPADSAEPMEPEPAPQPTKSDENSTTIVQKTIQIPTAKIADTVYLQQVITMHQQGKVNAVSILMKEEEGTLTYASTLQELQGTAIVAGEKVDIATAVSTLKAAGMHTSAILHADKDNLYSRKDPATLLTKTNGDAWIRDTKRCMDPSKNATTEYLIKLIQECGTIGFDEVILYDFGWPDGGSTQKIEYGDNQDLTVRANTLAKRLETIAKTVASLEVSVCLQDTQAQKGVGITGQSLAKLYPLAAHIYIPMELQTETSGDSLRTNLAAQTGGSTEKIIPMFTSQEVASSLFSGNAAMYFDPSETKGALDNYIIP